jgi:hypothetical protein
MMLKTSHLRAVQLSLLSVCSLLASVASAGEMDDCPDFPTPPAKVQWVAPYMVFNGVPMSIKRFDSEQRPSDVLAFYRRAWPAGPSGKAAVEEKADPWQVISAARGKCFFTVQVQASGSGSTGMLSVTRAPDRSRVVSPDRVLPMMMGSTVVNDIEHHDDGKSARTIVLSNTFSAESNADFYRQTLGDQGWKPVSSYQMTTKKGPGITLVMKRGLAEANLVISRSGSHTTVLANMVDAP